jgi:predicted RNA-binding Zn-ribbon protein involved in translation (DUF1610 family)
VVGHTTCESCGTRLTHLRGATGYVSICPRCGWSKVEVTNDERTVMSSVVPSHGALARHDESIGTQCGG